MFEINAFNLLIRSLVHRNFDVSTSFGSFGNSLEALRSFPNGDYYLFTFSFDAGTPLRCEINQSGFHSITEFESLLSAVDVKTIIMLCEETRFPHSW